MSGAIGSGITSWGLSLHFDPSPAPPSIDPSWISDREGHEGPRVWILGGFGHPSSNECRLTAREPGIADPSPEQARDLCRQRFVVSEIRPGFAERPADANGDLELEACENTEDGYVVRMPGAWFANAAGHIAACRRFSPVAPPQAIVEPDSNAVIDITVFDGSIGFLDAPTYLAFEELTVAGFRARRAEVSEENGKLVYWYELTLGTGAPEMGPTLLAATRESTGGDYVTNKVILDVMMRSLRLPEP